MYTLFIGGENLEQGEEDGLEEDATHIKGVDTAHSHVASFLISPLSWNQSPSRLFFSLSVFVPIAVKEHTPTVTHALLLTYGFLRGYPLAEGSPHWDTVCSSLCGRCS